MSTEKQTTEKGAGYAEQELTGRILEAAFAIHNILGAGFLEKVYENALVIELRLMGIACQNQQPIQVRYKGVAVGDYVGDIVVEGRVLVELKACSALDPIHEAQLMNYLRASGRKVGLLLNFGRPKLEYRRFVN